MQDFWNRVFLHSGIATFTAVNDVSNSSCIAAELETKQAALWAAQTKTEQKAKRLLHSNTLLWQ